MLPQERCWVRKTVLRNYNFYMIFSTSGIDGHGCHQFDGLFHIKALHSNRVERVQRPEGTLRPVFVDVVSTERAGKRWSPECNHESAVRWQYDHYCLFVCDQSDLTCYTELWCVQCLPCWRLFEKNHLTAQNTGDLPSFQGCNWRVFARPWKKCWGNLFRHVTDANSICRSRFSHLTTVLNTPFIWSE